MAIQLRSVNRVFKNEGLPLQLYKGRGYFYFVYDDVPANVYESWSVMANSLNQLALEIWLDEGREFAAKVRRVVAYRKSSLKGD